MLTRRISTNLFLFFGLLILSFNPSGAPIFAQKACVNSVSGQIYADTNNNGDYDLEDEAVSGTISIHARSTSKSIVYESTDGTFNTGTIPCDIYDVKFNGVDVGHFQILEVVGIGIRSFPIPEITPQDTTMPEQPYQVYLPLVKS